MLGLVLEGGGAKGAYHIGAYEALIELGFEFDGVAGTSIGALNGALIAQGDYDRARRLWEELEPGELFQVDAERLEEIFNMDLDRDNLGYILSKAKEIIKNRGIEVEGIRKVIEENVVEEKLRSRGKDFGMVTFSLSDMEPLELLVEDIPEGRLAEYIMASCYLPTFKMEKLADKYFLDGGFYDNLPINLLLQKDYDRIIAVRTFSRGRIRPVDDSGVQIEYIEPAEDLGRVLEFDRDQILRNIKLGYYDTHRFYRNLRGNRYYIEPEIDIAAEKAGLKQVEVKEKSVWEEKHFLQMFLQIPEEDIEEAAELLGDYNLPARRLLLEVLIPRLQELLEIDETADYSEIFLSCLELLALELEIEQFEFYSLSEFWEKISCYYKPQLKQGNHRVPKFIKRSDLLSFTIREDLAGQLIATLFSSLLQQEQLPGIL